MGNFGETFENVKNTAPEQFGNISQMVQEKLPTIKDSIQEQIPVINNKFEDTVTLCKSKFIPKEDKAEIYALYTYKEEKRNLSEGSENEEENSLPFGSYKEDAPANSKYNQEEADNPKSV